MRFSHFKKGVILFIYPQKTLSKNETISLFIRTITTNNNYKICRCTGLRIYVPVLML